MHTEPTDGARASRRGLYLAVAASLAVIAASAWWPAEIDDKPPVIPVAAAPQASPSPFGNGPAVTEPEGVAESGRGLGSGTAGAEPPEASMASADDYRTLMESFDERVRRNADDPSLKPMASKLDAGLDDQLASFQVEPGEALMLKADILDVLVGNRQERGPALLAWMRKQPMYQVPIGEPGDAEVQAYQRGEAELVMSWQALPPPQRDPQELESQLDRLLLQSFSLESS